MQSTNYKEKWALHGFCSGRTHPYARLKLKYIKISIVFWRTSARTLNNITGQNYRNWIIPNLQLTGTSSLTLHTNTRLAPQDVVAHNAQANLRATIEPLHIRHFVRQLNAILPSYSGWKALLFRVTSYQECRNTLRHYWDVIGRDTKTANFYKNLRPLHIWMLLKKCNKIW